MPITFGSVGDIVSVGLLIKDLVVALNESRGSQAEYKQLVDELNLLRDVLGRIDHLCNTTSTWTATRRFEVTALHDTTLLIAQNCRKFIEGFNVRLKKYDKTLGSSGARSKSEMLKATVAKIRWQTGEKEEVVRLHAEIASQTASLSLALGATTWSVGKDNRDILVRFGDDTGTRLQAQHGALSNISDTVDETNTLVSQTSVVASQTNTLVFQTHTLSNQIADDLANHVQAHRRALSKISDTATETKSLVDQTNSISNHIVKWLAKIGELCIEAKATMAKILFVNMATYKMVLALKTSLPGYLERSMFNEPFILEDAIGRISPVHLQFISSWEAFGAVLETRFRGIQGHEKIRRGHWTLQDHATGREISRRRNWEGAFLPGQRVNMSLLFQRETTIETFGSSTRVPASCQAACPRCQADVSDSHDIEIHCDTCGLCFRRIVEIEEVEPKPTPPAPKPWLDKPTFGVASFKSAFGPQPTNHKRRREADGFDITGFKRIQIVSKESRVRRHIFHPMPRRHPRPHTLDSTSPVRSRFTSGSVMTDSPKAASVAFAHHSNDTDEVKKHGYVHSPLKGFEVNQAYVLSVQQGILDRLRRMCAPVNKTSMLIYPDENSTCEVQTSEQHLFDMGVEATSSEFSKLSEAARCIPGSWSFDILADCCNPVLLLHVDEALAPPAPESSPVPVFLPADPQVQSNPDTGNTV